MKSSGTHCHGEAVAHAVAEKLVLDRIEEKLLEETSQRFTIPNERLVRAMTGPASFWNTFTHEKEKNIARLKVVLAERPAGGASGREGVVRYSKVAVLENRRGGIVAGYLSPSEARGQYAIDYARLEVFTRKHADDAGILRRIRALAGRIELRSSPPAWRCRCGR